MFGFGSSAVRILGPLTIDGTPLACPACKDTGKGHGHTITLTPKGDLATLTCGADDAHQFTHPAVTNKALKAMPGRGRFELTLDGPKLAGIAARPPKNPKKTVPAKGPSALAGGPAPALGTRGAAKAGPGLGGVLVAGLNTVTATVGAVGQIAGAAGNGARAVGDIAKAGSNAVSLARDGVQIAASNQAAHNALLATQQQQRAEDAARQHEITLTGMTHTAQAAADQQRTQRVAITGKHEPRPRPDPAPRGRRRKPNSSL
ncbi:hypothetical protein [Kitasatospora sp. NPDC059160]|uniref:hypothetical protein n=1 Tax=Kitasatospora sp. NPDC059160 TaxID=3346748 RepID=UPI0036B60E3F